MIGLITILVISSFTILTQAVAPSMRCIEDQSPRNGLGIAHDARRFNNVNDKHFLSGQFSTFFAKEEDREFRWRYCRPNDNTNHINPVRLTTTPTDDPWTRSCRDFNGGSAAIIEASGAHRAFEGDRVWTFRCGELSKGLSLKRCEFSGFVNQFRKDVNYRCPRNGVLRSIKSVHENGIEDRRWNFECCEIEGEYDFGPVIGEWSLVLFSNQPFVFTLEEGITTTDSISIDNTFASSLSTSISAGFDFAIGASVSTTVSSEVSRSVSKSIERSIERTTVRSFEVPCDGGFLYQWTVSTDVSISGLTSTELDVFSNFFLCVNEADPKCPPGYCNFDDDCQTCRAQIS